MERSRTISIAVVALFAVLMLPVGLAAQQHHHYKLIDLGSLGGPDAGIAEPNTGPLNKQGMLLGLSNTSNLDPYPNFPFFNGYVTRSVLWTHGTEIELPPLPGKGKKLSSVASAINALGLSIGQAQNGEVDQATGWPETRAVLWQGNSITDLGSLAGTQGIANAINDFGQVVGASATGTPDSFANSPIPQCLALLTSFCSGETFSEIAQFYPVTTETHAFLWHEGGHMRDLGTLGGPDSTAWMINNLGQVVGWSFINSTPNPSTGVPNVEPFFWSPEDGKMISMGNLGGSFGAPWWINNRGQVAGSSNRPGDQTEHPFIWSKATGMHDLLLDCTWCADFGHPDQINDAGQIVGYAINAVDQTGHGFLWTNGVMTDLGAPLVVGDSYEANSINSKGQITGGSDNDLYGFLWENGGSIVELNTLVVNPSDLSVANGKFINDRGEIACKGIVKNGTGDSHPCLLIPCDENHPGVEGCDYSMWDGNANATAAPAVQAPNNPMWPSGRGRRIP